MADLTIRSLRGGVNTSDPPSSIDKDQCTTATNVEFNASTCGERRRGSITIDYAGSDIVGHFAVAFLFNHIPSMDITQAELWAFGITSDSVHDLCRKTTVWSTIVPQDDVTGRVWEMRGQTLHNKLFLAYSSGVDRLHVWDGTSLRRVGIIEPTLAPTGANDGGVGTFTGTRFYRVRFTKQVGGVTKLRSEPSPTLTFVPNGNDTGVVVTRPAAVSEGETHWELEASTNDADFYIIATTILATTTATDTTDYVSGYAAADFELSETIGDYTLPYSPKFVSSDQDRLLIAGHWTDETLASRVSWTPVFGDVTGVGNDERIPIATDNFLDLDTGEGGALTAISNTVDGYIYAFKYSAIYKLVRTGVRARAYEAFALTKTRGAIEGSLIEGVDQSGKPCLYFLDPEIGPCRLGRNGLQTASQDIIETWKSANVDGIVAARGEFYAESQQVHWYFASGASEYPNSRLILQVNETKDEIDGVRKGWSLATVPAGIIVTAMCMFAENIDDDTARSLVVRPFIGTNDTSGLIQRCDTGNTDNGSAYVATIVSAPLSPVGILNRFDVKAGAILAKADTVTLNVAVIGNYDIAADQTKTVNISLAPTGTEDHVVRPIDNLSLSELFAVQVQLTDTSPAAGRWEINEIAFKHTPSETA